MATSTSKLGLQKPIPNVETDWGARLNESLDILDDAVLGNNLLGSGIITIFNDGAGNITISGSNTGATITLQNVFDNSDGTLNTTAAKPLLVTGSGIFVPDASDEPALVLARNAASIETQAVRFSVNDRRLFVDIVQDEFGGTAGGFNFDLGGNEAIEDSFIISSGQTATHVVDTDALRFVLSPNGRMASGAPANTAPQGMLHLTSSGSSQPEDRGMTIELLDSGAGSDWSVLTLNANANTGSLENIIEWEFNSIATGQGPGISARRPSGSSTDLAFFTTQTESRVLSMLIDGSAQAITMSTDLEVQGTVMNLANLPSSSGSLNPGDLWVDAADNYTLKVTPP